MSFRKLPIAIFLLAATAFPAAAQFCPGVQDPCTITGGSTVPAGVYDIRPRSLVFAIGQITVDTTGNLTVMAANVTFQPGARLIAPGPPDAMAGGTVVFEATGTINIQSAGTSKSRIDVTGAFAGGQISLTADGDINVNAALVANGTSRDGGGGEIDVTSTMGNLSITGDGLAALGGDRFGGGEAYLESTLGMLTLDAPVSAAKGDCSSCEIDLTAGTDIVTTIKGDIDAGASRAGDGGTIDIEATNNVTINGQLLASAAGNLDDGGGDGGDISVTADTGSAAINDRVEVDGASPDGGAGTVDFESFTAMTQFGPIFATSTGLGGDGNVSLVSDSGNLTVANIELSGDTSASSLFLNASGLLNIGGNIHGVLMNPALSTKPIGCDADIEACQLSIAGSATVTCTGPDVGQNIFLAGSTAISIAGHLTATVGNQIEWRSSPPKLTGSVIVPAPVIVQNLNLPCCGVNCTTTTTTTTTTSTTTISTSTTTTTLASTTSTTLPGTSSTTSPTTTSTTTITVATTTSTTHTTTTTGATTTTTSTTTLASTTTTTKTTTTTVASTTTTSGSTTSTTSTTHTTTTVATTSTSAPTTSSTVATTTSTTTAHATTSTTAPPASCLDTEDGIGAVRCRLTILTQNIAGAPVKSLGGKQPAKKLAGKLARATRQATDPITTKKLKHVAQQLKSFVAQVNRGLAKGKVDASIGTELATLAAQAQAELAGLITP